MFLFSEIVFDELLVLLRITVCSQLTICFVRETWVCFRRHSAVINFYGTQ